ncbi:hypothetical protein J3Q64DRAFT_1748982 [Phycomyces blakesleeanus]|uniref:Uncharacterized protein n=1 Tax=Phycomyces blakesleeanus TaxID=4837 RepID=A0ABR3AWQ6_PHYBL
MGRSCMYIDRHLRFFCFHMHHCILLLLFCSCSSGLSVYCTIPTLILNLLFYIFIILFQLYFL